MSPDRSRVARLLIAAALGAAGCTIHTHSGSHSKLNFHGPLEGFATACNWRDFNGTLFQFGLLGMNTRNDEILTLDLWPIGGIGVGVLGVRVAALPFEVAIGTLFYDPLPRTHRFRPSEHPPEPRVEYTEDERSDPELAPDRKPF